MDLALPGRHQAENLLAAATAASAFGVRAEQVAEVEGSYTGRYLKPMLSARKVAAE